MYGRGSSTSVKSRAGALHFEPAAGGTLAATRSWAAAQCWSLVRSMPARYSSSTSCAQGRDALGDPLPLDRQLVVGPVQVAVAVQVGEQQLAAEAVVVAHARAR